MTDVTMASPLQRAKTYVERVGLASTTTSIFELPGDASNRCYVRVEASDGSSYILLLHQEPIDSATLPFLNVASLLTRMSIPTPTIQDTADDLGIVVLDDLGDITLHRFVGAATDDQRIAQYTEAVDLIVRMQRKGKEIASPDYLPFTLAFDEDKLMSELEFFVAHFLVEYSKANIVKTDRTALREEFRIVVQELASQRRVLCHRDYHSRNLMLHHGKLHVIDFQDARMGPDTYDLVSLLRDCYVDHDTTFVTRLIAHYHKRMDTSVDSSYLERFDLMSVQRHLKALGTFGYQIPTTGSTEYVTAISRTLRYLADVFRRRSRFNRLRTILTTYVSDLDRREVVNY
jgi:aminoglycoside/choline kinase family phosphotransferase